MAQPAPVAARAQAWLFGPLPDLLIGCGLLWMPRRERWLNLRPTTRQSIRVTSDPNSGLLRSTAEELLRAAEKQVFHLRTVHVHLVIVILKKFDSHLL